MHVALRFNTSIQNTVH